MIEPLRTGDSDVPPAAAPTPEELKELRFVEGAEARLSRWLVALAALVFVAVAFRSLRASAGFAAGAILSYVNFHWLHRSTRRATEAMAENAISPGRASVAGAGMGFAAVLRLALVMSAGYVIFKSSVKSFYGYLGGLSISILAIFAEALYEAWVAVRRSH
jgi:hypothetical protein